MSLVDDLPIAVANNNPGNLLTAYGMNYATTSRDGFAVFRNPTDGWQALASQVHDLYRLKSLRTLKPFISHFKTASGTDLQSYALEICKFTCWNPLQVETTDINLNSPWRAQSLMLAISRIEAGATECKAPNAPYWWRMSDVFTGMARSNRWSSL